MNIDDHMDRSGRSCSCLKQWLEATRHYLFSNQANQTDAVYASKSASSMSASGGQRRNHASVLEADAVAAEIEVDYCHIGEGKWQTL